jgi:hypothetical protein
MGDRGSRSPPCWNRPGTTVAAPAAHDAGEGAEVLLTRQTKISTESPPRVHISNSRFAKTRRDGRLASSTRAFYEGEPLQHGSPGRRGREAANKPCYRGESMLWIAEHAYGGQDGLARPRHAHQQGWRTAASQHPLRPPFCYRQSATLTGGELDRLIEESKLHCDDPQTRAYIYEVSPTRWSCRRKTWSSSSFHSCWLAAERIQPTNAAAPHPSNAGPPHTAARL